MIPVKCFTCGKVIGDKYRDYVNQVAHTKSTQPNNSEVQYLTKDNIHSSTQTAEAIAMDNLGFNRMCCRRHMLTHVDIF